MAFAWHLVEKVQEVAAAALEVASTGIVRVSGTAKTAPTPDPPTSSFAFVVTGKSIVFVGAAVGALYVVRHFYRRARAPAIEGSLCVITGASQGIGAKVAEILAMKGAQCVLLSRTAHKLETVCEHIANSSVHRPVYYAVDCGDGQAMLEKEQAILKHYGTPDIIVNCAGGGSWRYLHEMDEKELRGTMDAPYFAAAFTSRAFLRHMIVRGSGTIVNVQSPAGYTAWGGATGYIAGRYALRGLTTALQADTAGTGVTVQEAVVGETTSSYFSNNPGSKERIPQISAVLGTLTPHEAAEAVVACIESGKPRYVYPHMLRGLFVLNDYWPDLVHWACTVTGWKLTKSAAARASEGVPEDDASCGPEAGAGAEEVPDEAGAASAVAPTATPSVATG